MITGSLEYSKKMSQEQIGRAVLQICYLILKLLVRNALTPSGKVKEGKSVLYPLPAYL